MTEKETYRIAIFGNFHRTELGHQISQLIDFFRDKNIVILMDEYMENYIRETLKISFENVELISDRKSVV